MWHSLAVAPFSFRRRLRAARVLLQFLCSLTVLSKRGGVGWLNCRHPPPVRLLGRAQGECGDDQKYPDFPVKSIPIELRYLMVELPCLWASFRGLGRREALRDGFAASLVAPCSQGSCFRSRVQQLHPHEHSVLLPNHSMLRCPQWTRGCRPTLRFETTPRTDAKRVHRDTSAQSKVSLGILCALKSIHRDTSDGTEAGLLLANPAGGANPVSAIRQL